MLNALLSSQQKIYLIHNHNNRDLDPQKDEINPLYWLAPSSHDIEQYLVVGSKNPRVICGIITEFGLLQMETDKDTFQYMGNPYFRNVIRQEAEHVQMSLADVLVRDLQSWAKEYRGVLSFSFTGVQ